MSRPLKLGSLFDGSGGFPLGGMLAGIEPVWASDVEPFPLLVTEKRMPDVMHLGDVTKIKGGEIPPVDIITFGSPCQDMSIAGTREGLAGTRSGLFFEAVRIIKEMRQATNGIYPRFAVWENVPGAFTSNKGADFHSVIEELANVNCESISIPRPEKWKYSGEVLGDSFSIAWRLLDAQHWGVPQRRRRIYLVADFDGGCAGQVLFDSEGSSRYSAQSFRAWQDTARSLESGIGEPSVCCRFIDGELRLEVTNVNERTYDEDALNTSGEPSFFDVRFTSVGTINARQNCYETTTSRTLDTGGNAPESNQGGIAVVYGVCAKNSNGMLSDNPHTCCYVANTTRTLDTSGSNPCCNQGGMVVVEGRGDRPSHRGPGFKESDVMYTLNTVDQHCVAFSTSKNTLHTEANENVAGTLVASDFKDPPTVLPSEPQTIVRRITPGECARLQGFPSWWCSHLGINEPTNEDLDHWREVFLVWSKACGRTPKPKTDTQLLKWLVAPRTDGAEYKLWGNGVALPCVFFVLAGIAAVIEK